MIALEVEKARIDTLEGFDLSKLIPDVRTDRVFLESSPIPVPVERIRFTIRSISTVDYSESNVFRILKASGEAYVFGVDFKRIGDSGNVNEPDTILADSFVLDPVPMGETGWIDIEMTPITNDIVSLQFQARADLKSSDYYFKMYGVDGSALAGGEWGFGGAQTLRTQGVNLPTELIPNHIYLDASPDSTEIIIYDLGNNELGRLPDPRVNTKADQSALNAEKTRIDTLESQATTTSAYDVLTDLPDPATVTVGAIASIVNGDLDNGLYVAVGAAVGTNALAWMR